MEIKSFKCPSCGASLQIPEGATNFFCTYCGSQIHVENGRISFDINANININQKYTDVARMRELDMIEQEKNRNELAARKERLKPLKWWLAILIWSIINSFLFLPGAFVEKQGTDSPAMGLLMLWMFSEIIGLFIFTALLPKKYCSQNHGCLTRIGWWFLIMIISEFITVLNAVLIYITIGKLFI